MTQPPQPPTYPDPLLDSASQTAQVGVGTATAALMGVQAVVARRAERAAEEEREAERAARRVDLPEESSAEEAVRMQVAREATQAAAIRVFDVEIANILQRAEEFDALAKRVQAAVDELSCSHEDVLREARDLRSLDDTDIQSITAVMCARVDWIRNPGEAHSWAASAAQTAHDHLRSPTPTPEGEGPAPEQEPAQDSAGVAAARRAEQAGESARQQAVTAAAAAALLDPRIAKAIQEAPELNDLADKVHAAAHALSSTSVAVLREAAGIAPLTGATKAPAAVMRARVAWVRDPGTAPPWATRAAQAAHTRLTSDGQHADTAAETPGQPHTPTDDHVVGTRTGRDPHASAAADRATSTTIGASFPDQAEPVRPSGPPAATPPTHHTAPPSRVTPVL